MAELSPTRSKIPTDAHWAFEQSEGCSVRNICSWHASGRTTSGNYLIQVSWPLDWPSQDHSAAANVVYLVDGNAMFLSATDVVRRHRSHKPHEPATIIVGIGYPLTDSVFSPRRALDLTPPCHDYVPPDGPDGQPRPQPYGGADALLDFISHHVRPFVTSVFPNISITRSALFGHSYGGLFVLHSLFTRPLSFDTYLAASPSIWWNDRFILSEESRFEMNLSQEHRPALRISYGSREQFPVPQQGETLDHYECRKRIAARRRMADNCKEMCERLIGCGKLHSVEEREHMDEDHGSVIAAALSGGILYFLNQAQ